MKTSLGCAAEPWGSINDRVHHRVTEMKNKRLVLFSPVLQVVDSLVRVESGQAAHRGGTAGGLVVFVENDLPVVVGAKGSKVIVEALGIWHAIDDGFTARDIPLADASCLTAGFANQLRKGNLVGWHTKRCLGSLRKEKR